MLYVQFTQTSLNFLYKANGVAQSRQTKVGLICMICACRINLVLLPSILLCINENSFVLVAGTSDGFESWKRKYTSGYVAEAEKKKSASKNK